MILPQYTILNAARGFYSVYTVYTIYSVYIVCRLASKIGYRESGLQCHIEISIYDIRIYKIYKTYDTKLPSMNFSRLLIDLGCNFDGFVDHLFRHIQNKPTVWTLFSNFYRSWGRSPPRSVPLLRPLSLRIPHPVKNILLLKWFFLF